MHDFHPNHIRLLVFDIDSLTVHFDQGNWDNFRQFLRVLDDRDFEIVLISESIEYSDWKSYSKLSVLKYNTMEALQKNNTLTGNDVFWFTEQPEHQTKLFETTHLSLAVMAAQITKVECSINIFRICSRFSIPVKLLQLICPLNLSNLSMNHHRFH